MCKRQGAAIRRWTIAWCGNGETLPAPDDAAKAAARLGERRAAGDAIDLVRMLYIAVSAGTADVLELLVKHGADIAAEVHHGPLRAAALMVAVEERTRAAARPRRAPPYARCRSECA